MRAGKTPKDSEPQQKNEKSVPSSSIAILEEKIDESYEPTEKEIRDYAEWLGMDPDKDKDLLWIAARGLKTPLPKPWQPCESGGGEVFYFNPETGESQWDHPCDDELRALYKTEKEKLGDVAKGSTDTAKEKATDERSASSSSTSEKDAWKEAKEEVKEDKVLPVKKLDDSLQELESIESSIHAVSVEEIQKFDELQSFSLEETPPRPSSSSTSIPQNEDLTGKALPPPPTTETSLDPKLRRGDKPSSLAPLTSLAPLGPLPPLSLPLNKPLATSLPSSSSSSGPKALEDVLGSPMDLLNSINLNSGNLSSQGSKATDLATGPSAGDKKSPEADIQGSGAPMMSKPPLPKAPPPMQELSSEELEDLPVISSTAAIGEGNNLSSRTDEVAEITKSPRSCDACQTEEAQTPPLSSKVKDVSEGKSLEVQLKLDSLSPPTPELADVLAAELRQEDQLSLWSQIDEDHGSSPFSVEKKRTAAPADALAVAPGNSLEISSLSAILEHSPVRASSPCVAGSIMAELRLLEQGCTPAPSPLPSPIFPVFESPVPTKKSHVERLHDALQKECARSESNIQSITMAEVEPLEQAASIRVDHPTSDFTPRITITALAEDATSAPVNLPEDMVAEVPSLMCSGGLRETVKMSWDEVTGRPTIMPTATASVAPVISVATPESTGDSTAAAAQQRIAQLEAELQSFVQRLKGVEAGSTQSEKLSKGSSAPKSGSTENLEVNEKLAAYEEKVASATPTAMDIITPTMKATTPRTENLAELQRLRWELRQSQEEASGVDGLLQDSRHALGLEQAAHANTKSALRDSQRELQRLRSQLTFRDAEVERFSSELQRCQAELADQEAQGQRLQIRLQAKDAELLKLRQRGESAVQAQRMEITEWTRMLREKELSLEDRAQNLEDAELRLSKKQFVKSEADLEAASRRRNISPATATLSARNASRWPLTARTTFTHEVPIRMTESIPTEDSMLLQCVTQSPGPGEVDCPAEVKSAGLHHLSGTMSSAASTASLREIRCLADLSGDEGEIPEVSGGTASHRAGSQPLPRCSSRARLGQDFSETLRLRRRELRREHAELEEDRKRWREEARKLKKLRAAEGAQTVHVPESLARTRNALDARAAALNKAISEYRTMQRLLASSHPSHRSAEPTTVMGFSTAEASKMKTPRASSASALLRSTPSLRDDDLLKRWQHMLVASKEDMLLTPRDHEASKESHSSGRRVSRGAAVRAAPVGGA